MSISFTVSPNRITARLTKTHRNQLAAVYALAKELEEFAPAKDQSWVKALAAAISATNDKLDEKNRIEMLR